MNAPNVTMPGLENNTIENYSFSLNKGIENPFWSQFKPTPYLTHVVIGVWTCLFGALAIFGNGFVMYVFWR